MNEPFAQVLAVGGKSNSLGRAEEVVQLVLDDESQLEQLYNCLFEDDAWVRMRAVDALEKVCRERPEWFEPYVDRFFREIASHAQPSIQWHLAQMFAEINLTPKQRNQAVDWLVERLQTMDVDWIVSANSMKTLTQFTQAGYFPQDELIPLLRKQQHHKSKSVVKRATKLLASMG